MKASTSFLVDNLFLGHYSSLLTSLTLQSLLPAIGVYYRNIIYGFGLDWGGGAPPKAFFHTIQHEVQNLIWAEV